MNVQETAKLINVIMIAYPRYAQQIQEHLEETVMLWSKMFQDVQYEVANCAVQKLILDSSYPPTIHDLRQEIVSVQNPNRIDGAEAWGEVTSAIRFFGYYNPNEALESMSETTRKVVKAIGWQEICLSENPDVVRGQFIKLYNSLKEREEKEMLLPEILKKRIEELTKSKVLSLSEFIINTAEKTPTSVGRR